MNRWRVVIEAWPYFGVEQAAAGDRSQTFYVEADCARSALKLAEHIVKGMEAGPAIWKAPIQSIALDRPTYQQDEVAPVGPIALEVSETSAQHTQGE